ncbi:hypothetical protein ACFL59_03760 [Planctomycetota bacterium]
MRSRWWQGVAVLLLVLAAAPAGAGVKYSWNIDGAERLEEFKTACAGGEKTLADAQKHSATSFAMAMDFLIKRQRLTQMSKIGGDYSKLTEFESKGRKLEKKLMPMQTNLGSKDELIAKKLDEAVQKGYPGEGLYIANPRTRCRPWGQAKKAAKEPFAAATAELEADGPSHVLILYRRSGAEFPVYHTLVVRHGKKNTYAFDPYLGNFRSSKASDIFTHLQKQYKDIGFNYFALLPVSAPMLAFSWKIEGKAAKRLATHNRGSDEQQREHAATSFAMAVDFLERHRAGQKISGLGGTYDDPGAFEKKAAEAQALLQNLPEKFKGVKKSGAESLVTDLEEAARACGWGGGKLVLVRAGRRDSKEPLATFAKLKKNGPAHVVFWHSTEFGTYHSMVVRHARKHWYVFDPHLGNFYTPTPKDFYTFFHRTYEGWYDNYVIAEAE